MALQERVAAIDIGSNAIRMVIAEHTPLGIRMLKRFRIPIRLGADVFEKGRISPKNLKQAARTFAKFKDLTKKFEVKKIRAVGTSALRESKNGAAFVELIKRKSTIQIEVIDGDKEAALIHSAIDRELPLTGFRTLALDIGGGSVELTFSENGKMKNTKSFPIGTVRTLELLKKRHLQEAQLNVIIAEYMPLISKFLHQDDNAGKLDFAIGTGGNLERIAKMKGQLFKKNYVREVALNEVDELIQKVRRLTVKERIEKLDMRPDRADVILPALLIVQIVMRQAGVERLVIPGVGLKEGLIWSMLEPST